MLNFCNTKPPAAAPAVGMDGCGCLLETQFEYDTVVANVQRSGLVCGLGWSMASYTGVSKMLGSNCFGNTRLETSVSASLCLPGTTWSEGGKMERFTARGAQNF